MNDDQFYQFMRRPDLVKTGFLVMIIILAITVGLASCAPGEVTSDGSEPMDWHSMGKGTFYKVIKPFSSSASLEGCVVVRTGSSTGSDVAVSVDCYGG